MMHSDHTSDCDFTCMIYDMGYGTYEVFMVCVIDLMVCVIDFILYLGVWCINMCGVYGMLLSWWFALIWFDLQVDIILVWSS